MNEKYSKQEVAEFIRRELRQHGDWLCDRFVEALEKNGNRITGELERSLGWRLTEPSDGAAGLEIGFESYGRFFEIKGNDRLRKLNDMPMSVNRIVWGIKERKRRKKSTRWYARNMYGGLGRLVSRLSAGISEDELATIRETIKNSDLGKHGKVI